MNGTINKGQRYYRNKTIKSNDIITGETRSIIEIEDASVMEFPFIINNRNDNNNFIEKLKYRDKAYVSPYAKFDRIRKRLWMVIVVLIVADCIIWKTFIM